LDVRQYQPPNRTPWTGGAADEGGLPRGGGAAAALAALSKDIHVIVSRDPVKFEADLKAGLYWRGFGKP
jgi:hypothetical protein